eukprot:sb/3476967/
MGRVEVLSADVVGGISIFTESRKGCKPGTEQPIRTRYSGHVTGYQPIRDRYFNSPSSMAKEDISCLLSVVFCVDGSGSATNRFLFNAPPSHSTLSQPNSHTTLLGRLPNFNP